MAFDIEAARKDGLDDDTIVEIIKQNEQGFDFDAALNDGLSHTQVLDIYNQGTQMVGSGIETEAQRMPAKLDTHDFTVEELQQKFAMQNIDEEGNVTPLTTEQRVQLQEASTREKMNTDMGKGFESSIHGMVQTGIDIADVIGIDVKELDDYNKQAISTLNEEIKDKDFFSLGNLGKVIPTLVSLPVAYKSMIAAFLVEGAIGYSEARGSEATKGEAATVGAIAGGATVGIMKLIDALGSKAVENTFKYYKNKFNYTDDEAEAIFKDWSKTMDTDGSYGDRLRALIDYAGDKGAQVKADLARIDPEGQQIIEAGRAERLRNIKKLIETDVNAEDISKQLKNAIGTVKKNYNKVKWEIKNVKAKGEPIRLPEVTEGLDEALDEVATDRAAIKELLYNKDVAVQDLIDAMPHVNSIIRRSKSKQLNQWTRVKDSIDSKLKESLDPSDYAKWREVNSDYVHMVTARDSKIGEALRRATGKAGKKSQIEPSRVLELMKADKDSGVDTFESFRYLLGSKNTADLEKLIIRDMFAGHADDISWEAIAKSLNHKGFVSAEGKQLQELIDNIAKSFKTDDVLRTAAMKVDPDQGGIGKNIMEKFQISLAGRIFRQILKMGPTKGANAMRMADRLAKVLKSPSKMKDINRRVSILGEGIKDRLVQETLADMPKLIEYKPNMRIPTAQRASKIRYVTPKGQAVKGSEVSTALQADDLTDWIRGTNLPNLESNKVIDSVFKIVNDTRIGGILTRTSKKLKVDKARYNEQVVNKIINNEAKWMAKEIAKDSGVKLGDDDVRKLVHHLFKKYMEECK